MTAESDVIWCQPCQDSKPCTRHHNQSQSDDDGKEVIFDDE